MHTYLLIHYKICFVIRKIAVSVFSDPRTMHCANSFKILCYFLNPDLKVDAFVNQTGKCEFVLFQTY